MPSYPRPHVMVQVLAERAEDFILQSYKIRDVPLKLRPVSSERSRREPAQRHGVVYLLSRHQLCASLSTVHCIATCLLSFLANTQAIVVSLGIWILMLGVLGLAPLPELPLNDKALHFFGVSSLADGQLTGRWASRAS